MESKWNSNTLAYFHDAFCNRAERHGGIIDMSPHTTLSQCIYLWSGQQRFIWILRFKSYAIPDALLSQQKSNCVIILRSHLENNIALTQ